MATIVEPFVTPGGEIDLAMAQGEALLLARRRITVAEYHRMAEAGVFGPDARVELLEGVIVSKMSKNPPHVLATDLLDDLLHRLVPADFFVSMGNPVTIEERDSEPDPMRRSSGAALATTRGVGGPSATRPWSSRWPIRATPSTGT